MPKRASVFIGLTIAVGCIFIADSLSRDRDFGELGSYMICFVLALLTSTLKVRIPGINGTISVNFLFVLIATAIFTFSETVLLGSAASVVQCLWRARRRPKAVQVSFNVAVLAISSALTYRISHLPSYRQDASLILLLVLATCCYFTVNTFLISGVLSLVESRRLVPLWQNCYMWSFPYYLMGAVIAGLTVLSSRTVGWAMSLPILSLMLLVYVFYRTCVERMAPDTAVSRS